VVGLQGAVPGFLCRQRLEQIVESGSRKQMQILALINLATEIVDNR
jgi:hypothetical protein